MRQQGRRYHWAFFSSQPEISNQRKVIRGDAREVVPRHLQPSQLRNSARQRIGGGGKWEQRGNRIHLKHLRRVGRNQNPSPQALQKTYLTAVRASSKQFANPAILGAQKANQAMHLIPAMMKRPNTRHFGLSD
jgi:hypothetical protein